MDEVLYDALIEVARSAVPTTTTYTDVALRRGLDVRADIAELARRLDEISSHEHASGRPLLSVAVVHRDGDRMPGEGFFRLARRLGVQGARTDNLTFFAQELQRCRDFWRNRETRSV